VVAFTFQEHVVLTNLRLYAFFLAGMLLYSMRDRERLSIPVAVGAIAIWLFTFGTPLMVVASAAALPYVLLVLAYRTPRSFKRLVSFGDVSYGLYIYAFPVQQLTALTFGDSVSPLVIFAIALPVSWGLGLASWRLVERPALQRKPASKNSSAAPSRELQPVLAHQSTEPVALHPR
jgi:peptidoglycan/LPS O-acetylase OafA/YrhL